MTTYTVHDYTDGHAIGEITLTPEQFRRYERDAQQPEGIIPIGDLLILGGEYVPSDVVAASTTVYIEA